MLEGTQVQIRQTKNKMVEIVENIVDTIFHLEKEQSKVLAYMSELEERRKYLLGHLESLNEDILTDSAKKKLSNKIIQMEMKATFVESNEKQSLKDTKQRKCRHNNAGYCKMKAECVYYHSDIICEEFFQKGKCSESQWCLKRHPKECKFWKGDPRGCLRGQQCRYLHKHENKGINIKATELSCSTKDNDSKINESKTDKKGKDTHKTSDEQSHGNVVNDDSIVKDMDMDDDKSQNNDNIREWMSKSDALEKENNVLKEQLNKLQRVVINMNNHIEANQG